MKVDWTEVAEIKWSKDGALMIRKPGGAFLPAKDFLKDEYDTFPPDPNSLACKLGPPKNDVACVTVPIRGVRPLPDGVEVKLPGGQVVRLDSLFSLDTEPPEVE